MKRVTQVKVRQHDGGGSGNGNRAASLRILTWWVWCGNEVAG